MRNLSLAGARVAFTNAAAVPDEFDLTIARKDRTFRARTIWRGLDEAGVAFLSEYAQTVPIPLEWAKRLRDCEAEKAALHQRIVRLTESSAV